MLRKTSEERPRFFGLYGLALQRIYVLKGDNDIIPYPDVFSALCKSFQIPKRDAWELLYILRDMGHIEIVRGHGIKLISVNNQ